MRKPTALVAVALLFVLALFALRADGPHAGQNAPAPVQKWEYQIYGVVGNEFSIASDGQKRLNAKGMEGWEFCQVVSVDGQLKSVILKRPLR
ncbi:MAG: hypothetical protein WD894_05490 [Pirellulales bacterium]